MLAFGHFGNEFCVYDSTICVDGAFLLWSYFAWWKNLAPPPPVPQLVYDHRHPSESVMITLACLSPANNTNFWLNDMSTSRRPRWDPWLEYLIGQFNVYIIVNSKWSTMLIRESEMVVVEDHVEHTGRPAWQCVLVPATSKSHCSFLPRINALFCIAARWNIQPSMQLCVGLSSRFFHRR